MGFKGLCFRKPAALKNQETKTGSEKLVNFSSMLQLKPNMFFLILNRIGFIYNDEK